MINPSASAQNPFVGKDQDGQVLYQLKFSLILYLDYPPGPKRARKIYDLYMAQFGQHIKYYRSTGNVGPAEKWDANAKNSFEHLQLPQLQKQSDWGYAFFDGNELDYYLFMFHGYKKVSEAGKASFFRFEWPWNTDPALILQFTKSVCDSVPFLSGSAGYILNPQPFEPDAFDKMYAICSRYWGIEAWNMDLTVNHVLDGYKCVNWLTLIGDRLLTKKEKTPTLLDAINAFTIRTQNGFIVKSRNQPEFLDQNRNADCNAEKQIATALLPLQIEFHEDFGAPAWEGNTMDWLKRFTG